MNSLVMYSDLSVDGMWKRNLSSAQKKKSKFEDLVFNDIASPHASTKDDKMSSSTTIFIDLAPHSHQLNTKQTPKSVIKLFFLAKKDWLF